MSPFKRIPWRSGEPLRTESNVNCLDLELILYKTFLDRGDADTLVALFSSDNRKWEELECRFLDFQDSGVEVPSVDKCVALYHAKRDAMKKKAMKSVCHRIHRAPSLKKTKRQRSNAHALNNPICGLERSLYTYNMITYKYFLDRGDGEALNVIFPDENWRKLYEGDLKQYQWPDLAEMVRHLKLYRARIALGPMVSSERIWKCQKCGKDRKGSANVLCRHIALHLPNEFPCECVIEGCGRVFTNPFSAREHLKPYHETSVGKLNEEEFDRLKHMSSEFLVKMNPHLPRFFPAESFRGFTCYNFRHRNSTTVCKSCGQKIRKLDRCRKEHIAVHLNLEFMCFLENCFKTFPDPWRLSSHYSRVHGIVSKTMTPEQSFIHRNMKQKFNNVTNDAYPKFFDLLGGEKEEDE